MFHDIDYRFRHAGNGIEPAAAIGIGADAWQYDAVCGGDALGVISKVDVSIDAGFAGGALESLGGRA
jgi:hypothetical protein